MSDRDRLAVSSRRTRYETDSVGKNHRVTVNDHVNDSRDLNDLSVRSIETEKYDIDLTFGDALSSAISNADRLLDETRSAVVIEARKSIASQIRSLKKNFKRTLFVEEKMRIFKEL